MLSIIIPALNEQDYLPLVLAEIKDQGFSGYEIIVADSNSQDDTVKVARSFGCKLTQGGLPAKGRNQGAKIASGELFLFIDADAITLPVGFLNELTEKFKSRKLDIASFPIYPQGKIIDKIFYWLYNLWAKLSQSFLPHATNVILVKKEIHQVIGGFDERVKFAEDHDYVRRAKKHGRFGFIDIGPVLVSARRFEKDGRLVTYLRYVLAGLWVLFFGSIKSDIFQYRFDYSLKIKNKIGYNMSNMYKLPKIKFPIIKLPKLRSGKLKLLKPVKSESARLSKKQAFSFLILIIFISSIFGFLAGAVSGSYFYWEIKDFFSRLNIEITRPVKNEEEQTLYTFQEQAIVNVVQKASPSVVSIIVTKDLPVLEKYYTSPFEEFFFEPFYEFQVPQYRQKGTEKKEIGGGTGFIVSEDGMIITNKHVVLDEDADYTVVVSSGKQFPAKVLAKDPLQDIAILKIDQVKTMTGNGEVNFESFSKVELGNSDKIQIGQTAIAIGYVLGRYQNTVSVGIISGLGRTIEASSGDFVEILEDIIQTDTAINKGNSGGPLLNSKGEVIGINTAIDLEGQSVGFAIPINKAKRDIEQVKAIGKIVYPFLGVRYAIINEDVQKENDLAVDYGAWVIKGAQGEAAVFLGSAADDAGIKEGDIILEFDNEKITTENTLAKIIMKYSPGDEITLKILSGEQEKTISLVLGERSS
ncbi:MAG: trypsin-like peptidase domain-containing protein [Candidatus Nealsonbacteria bacterium]